jgi:hypothetical protein
MGPNPRFLALMAVGVSTNEAQYLKLRKWSSLPLSVRDVLTKWDNAEAGDKDGR